MLHHKYGFIAALFAAFLFLQGCSSDTSQAPLEGERISIMTLQEALVADVPNDEIVLPNPWANQFWPQAGGYPNHSMQNLALSNELKLAWKADIGRGLQDDIPLTVQPVVVGGLVYTLDTKAQMRAFDVQNGKEVWRRHVGAEQDDDPVILGGIAYGYKRLYVTNGLNEILAIEPKSGEIVWRQKIPSPSQAAPSVLDGRIYVNTIDNRLVALNEIDGSILWEYSAITEGTGLVGAASAAVNSEIVIPVFSSGELAALHVENGGLAWADNLDSVQRFGGLGSISDIKALPVIDRGLLIAMNYSGRIAAIDLRSGNRIWQRDIGGPNTPWVAGDYVFVLSSDNHLIALSRKTGMIYWVSKLPSYEDEEDRDSFITWQGPVLAGNRLILVSSDRRALSVDATTGDIANRWKLPASVKIPPVVAEQTLYLLSDSGILYAYR